MKIIYDEKERKKFYVPLDKNEDLNTYTGIIKIEDIKKAKAGQCIKSHKGTRFKVFDADFVDMFRHIKRGPQIITLKDAGTIVAYTGIGSGSKVVEAGSGSGALTCFLANIVKPTGKVYSYEIRDEFMDIAKKNVMNMGLIDYVEFRNKDVKDMKEKDVDVIILDLPNPWSVIDKCEKRLKPGGRLVCYLPTINQVIKLIEEENYYELELLEVMTTEEVRWKTEEGAFRPLSKSLHTAFLVFFRKM